MATILCNRSVCKAKMACEICEHCNYPISFDDDISMHEGYSYHEECHKCFVCSETDLHKAEVLLGTILCYGCSQRIFQGCAAVKRAKRGEPRKRRRNYRAMEGPENYKDKELRMTQMLLQTKRDNKSESVRRKSRPIKYFMEKSIPTTDSYSVFNNNKELAKVKSNEIGITTDVTRYLLECMESSFAKMLEGTKQASEKQTDNGNYVKKDKLKNEFCSSKIRCAELGASTEIINMALRKKSEVAVIIKSQSQMKQTEPEKSLKLSSDVKTSTTKQTSGTSANNYVESEFSMRKSIFDMQLGTCLLLPLIASFKRNILDRSSVVNSVILKHFKKRSMSNKRKSVVPRKRVNHHKRSVRRLYSTINRNRNPYKMGWLDLTSKSFCCIKSGDCTAHPIRCKHYRRSRNYRRLRNKAMRLAGPTKSQLAGMRAKIFSPFTKR